MVYVDGGVWQYGDESKPSGRRTYFAGTMCKHPLVMAAVNAVLDRILESKDHMYEALNAKVARMASDINSCCSEMGVALRIEHYGSQFRFVVPPNIVKVFYQTLRLNGVYCQEGRSCFLNTAHTECDIDSIVQATKRTALALQWFPMLVPSPAAPVCYSTQRLTMIGGRLLHAYP